MIANLRLDDILVLAEGDIFFEVFQEAIDDVVLELGVGMMESEGFEDGGV